MASYGTILTRVFTSNAQLPVAGATVAFTQQSTHDGRHTLLAVRITDENGRTAPVQVSTPDLAASEVPGNVTPFAVCDIWAEAPGYELQLVENVQIFPGTQTLQILPLVPLEEQEDNSLPEAPVIIPPQNL